jgi:hypothetical protein
MDKNMIEENINESETNITETNANPSNDKESEDTKNTSNTEQEKCDNLIKITNKEVLDDYKYTQFENETSSNLSTKGNH